MRNTTVDVVIDTDEKYPEYEIVLYDVYKNVKKFNGYQIIRQTVNKLPLAMFNKFRDAQKKYYDIEAEMELWLKAHPESERIEIYEK